jgi:hypothetical protein
MSKKLKDNLESSESFSILPADSSRFDAARPIPPSSCESCGAPNHACVLRQYGWWTLPTLEATVWAMNGRFTDVLPEMSRESNGAVITAVPGKQFIALPWRHAGSGKVNAYCFPNTGEHRWVSIQLSLYGGRFLCQWCRFRTDPRFHRVAPAAALERKP